MTVVVEAERGWLVDHQQFIDRDIAAFTSITGNLEWRCKPDLFNICCPFLMDSEFTKYSDSRTNVESKETEGSTKTGEPTESPKNHKKRKRRTELNDGEKAASVFHEKVREILLKAYDQLVSLGKDKNAFRLNSSDKALSNNISARKAAVIKGAGDRFVESSYSNYNCENPLSISDSATSVTESIINRMVKCENESARRVEIEGSYYLIPPRCRFLMSDISRMRPLVQDRTKYNLIVLDPPWENKSVKRKKKYSSLRNEDILELPIPEVMDERECLVAVWVTNKQQQHRFVLEDLFPCWGLDYVTTWFWLKITQHGETVLPLDNASKKPYECIILGRSGDIRVPSDQVIISVPCAVHSWKPPLSDVLKSLVREDAACLELFARNLQFGWTSWGNEVLLHQHEEFFEQSPETDTQNIPQTENG